MTKRVSLTETNNWDGQQADFEEREAPRSDWDCVVEISDEMFERWTRVRAEWQEMEAEINRLYKEEIDHIRALHVQEPASEPDDDPTANRGISVAITSEQILQDSTDSLLGNSDSLVGQLINAMVEAKSIPPYGEIRGSLDPIPPVAGEIVFGGKAIIAKDITLPSADSDGRFPLLDQVGREIGYADGISKLEDGRTICDLHFHDASALQPIQAKAVVVTAASDVSPGDLIGGEPEG